MTWGTAIPELLERWNMPKVKVTETCIVHIDQTKTTTYSPIESTLAPDAHIDEIVRQGKGERLTDRGTADMAKVGDAAS